MHAPFKIALASTLALATAVPAYAQYSGPYEGYYGSNGSPYRPTDQYQQAQQDYYQQQRQYEEQRENYDARRSDYDRRRDGYERARAEYDRRLAAYNRARADYDARYGYGAYVRVYGPPPVWDETHWAYYLPATPYYAPAAPAYGADTAYVAPAPIQCDNRGTVTAGAIGALAGAVLGSQLSASGRHTENAVLGGVLGAGIGAAVGHAHDKYKCDQRGAYFTYNETIPYREGRYYRSDRYSEYQRMGCRLAPAPVDSYASDYRYVRVCPDPDGRYRIVG